MIEHPRIRSKENTEIPLKTYNVFQGPKAIRKSLVRDIILGISSRNYEESIEKLLNGYGVKKSSLSRHFVKATSEQMRVFLERSLLGLQLCVILIDGLEFKGDLLIVALGLYVKGYKHVLGLWQGATENAQVCKNLLEDMERRGLDTSKDYLFVLYGSKALRSAVTKMFGQYVSVQRCQLHKRRNVREHLPPEHQEAADARIRAAYNMTKYEDAKKSLDLTVKYLETLNPSAASSLKEGMEETLTMHKLGVGELLRKTLSSTNTIESCFSITRAITDRVKRWKKGNMVQRWAVAALLRAEKKFKRVKGYKDIPKLLIALKEVSLTKKNLDRKELVA